MGMTRRKFLIGGGVVAIAGGAGILTPLLTREGRLIPGKPRFGFVEGSEGALPKQADVVVVGAGILGLMTAINLVERGLSVVVVEKGDIAGEQSCRFYGQVMTYKMPDATFQLHHLAKQRWREMNAKVGADTSYRTQGRVEVPFDEEDLENVRKWIDVKSREVAGGSLTGTPSATFADTMQNLGVDVPTLPAYQSQQIISAAPRAPGGNVALPGNIYFREQADGTYATSPRVVVAPVVKESFMYGYKYLPLLAIPDFPVHISLNKQLIDSFTQPTQWRLDEVSPFEKNRLMTAAPDIPELDASLEKLKVEFPAFKDAKLIDQWSGAMAIAPDENPIISQVNEYPGLVINTATGWGMTESPVSSELTADLLLGKAPVLDPKPFSLYRF